MKNLVCSELYRMLKSKKNRILLIITMIIFAYSVLFLRFNNVGFYNKLTNIDLNSLNSSPFILKEMHLFLVFIFCPMVFCESFNHENTCGAYRLFLIRGYDKTKCILSKIIACAIFTGAVIISLFILSVLLESILFDKTSFTSFVNKQISFNFIGALFYNFKFYLLEYMIMLILIGITSIIGSLMPNAAITYVVTVGICISLVYINKNIFSYIIVNTPTLFDVLDSRNNTFILSSIILIIGTCGISTVLFKKRDYLN
ncbi:hypothetical protein [Clostridium oceanicum]|uniref:ABC-2 family transporter protein n=1 Tax=Clostridium oceanicum TaxID=1543 RepID=A0ABN1JXH1_9CLOT